MRLEYQQSWPALSDAEIRDFVSKNRVKFGSKHEYDAEKIATELISKSNKRASDYTAGNANADVDELSREFNQDYLAHFERDLKVSSNSRHFTANQNDVDEITELFL